MILYRIAIARFQGGICSDALLNRYYGSVHLTVGKNKIDDQKDDIVILASTKLEVAPISEEGYWDIPDSKREACEHAIEYATSLASMANGARREILSPPGYCVAIGAESEGELNELKKCRGFKDEAWDSGSLYTYPREIVDNEQLFNDRKEGVLLLAEAISHSSCTGTFRDIMRLFESAFRLPTKQLDKKLYQFLDPSFGYTRQEIIGWIDLRDPLSHADGKKAKNIVLYESTVAPIIFRMKQAAYDVVLNKAHWGDPSQLRRAVYSPGAYLAAPRKPVIREGATGINFTTYDRYNIYKNLIQGNFSFQNNYFVPVK